MATRPISLQCRASSGVGIGLNVQPMMDCLMRPLRMRKSGSTAVAPLKRSWLAALAVIAALFSQERLLSGVEKIVVTESATCGIMMTLL